MTAYDALLTAMQEMAHEAYHTDRQTDDRHWRKDWEYSPDEVNDRLILPLKDVLTEITDHLIELAEKQTNPSRDLTASDYMRAIGIHMAALEIAAYAEGAFCFEPLEMRLPGMSTTEEMARSILDHFRDPRTKTTPHFMYDATSGVVTGLYSGAPKTPQEVPLTEEQLKERLVEVGHRI
jgi:hypothetical protein